jgi:hypothetical protein
MTEYKRLIKHAIDSDLSVSVWDGEEWQVKRSRSFDDIVEAIESVEEAQIRIRTANKALDPIGWALIFPGLADDETIADYSGEFIDAWFQEAL